MADETFSYQDNQEQIALEKKLRKREQRLLGRLQEAHAAHEHALERFQRAQARLFKRAARVQRLEARLTMLRQQLATLASSGISVDTTLVTDDTSETIQGKNISPLFADEQDVERAAYAFENETDPLARARAARAVATATEEAARLAVERAHEVAMRLAHRATGRHLIQELLTLEADAARASVAALDAELAAQDAEQLADASSIEPTQPSTIEVGAEDRTPTKDEAVQQPAAPPNDVTTLAMDNEAMPENAEKFVGGDVSVTNDETMPENADTSAEAAETTTSDEEGLHEGLPTQEERERVAEIDEEEEMVEMVTSMMIADVAAARAAKAEALAEEASAHTREARRLTQEADTVLERIRAAIHNGTSVGDAAQAILFDAERDATHTHALLADAEAAEERARRIAMEAEADAEVAEGMAFAADERNEDAEVQRERQPLSHPLLDGIEQTGNTGEIERLDGPQNVTEKKVEDEDTIETPSVQQQS